MNASVFSRNASKIVTLEYGWFISEHPSWEFIRPTEFHQRYLDGPLDTFDAVFTYSSLEHSGLGQLINNFVSADISETYCKF